jgi:ribonuclease E
LTRHEKAGSSLPDVFTLHRIDEQLVKALDRKVWLPSGGTLVIDRTEAMTVIDVNTGKFTGSGGNLEETVTRNNLEAAEEIVRQMRLRDIGGMIVVDFIDMVLESNRDLVLRRLTECLGRDRTRHQVSEVTSLGLVQMTRKKLGTGLVEAFSTTCEHCHGRGILVHDYPVEVAPAEDAVKPAREGRRRRGRDRAAQPEPAANGHQPEAVAASVKRAHPVALAMASHHADEDIDLTPAVIADEAHLVDEAPVEAAPVEIVAAQAEVGEPTPTELEPAPAAVPQPAPAQPRARGRRRVSRTTAAPVTAGEGTVVVVPTDVSAAEPVAWDIPVAPPTPRRRARRSAVRPTGAPTE